MASPIGGMKNVKIFVLYLMANIGYPMNFATINDVTLQNDYVMYLDFADAWNFNRAVVIVAPLLVWLWARWLWRLAKNKQ